MYIYGFDVCVSVVGVLVLICFNPTLIRTVQGWVFLVVLLCLCVCITYREKLSTNTIIQTQPLLQQQQQHNRKIVKMENCMNENESRIKKNSNKTEKKKICKLVKLWKSHCCIRNHIGIFPRTIFQFFQLN